MQESSSNKKDIYVFWHVATMGNWEEVVEEQADVLERSGLAKIAKIFVCKVGPASWTPRRGMHLALDQPTLDRFEFPTLKLLYDESQNKDFYCLYMHTKGVSKTVEHWDANAKFYREKLHLKRIEDLWKNEKEWRQYMQHFLVKKHQQCIAALDEYDIGGVSWSNHPRPHFRGNFWWARSDYIRKLSDPYKMWCMLDELGMNRAGSEFWIGTGGPTAKCFFSTDHNLYSWGLSKQHYIKTWLS
jgi:hypothetical protein